MNVSKVIIAELAFALMVLGISGGRPLVAYLGITERHFERAKKALTAIGVTVECPLSFGGKNGRSVHVVRTKMCYREVLNRLDNYGREIAE